MTDYGFIRVSSGSQDAKTQERDILGAFPGAIIATPDTKSASASKGQQLDALDAVIAKLRKGDRVIVTDSSRLDRRDNLTSQVATMMSIRETGAVIVSLAPGEEQFANSDDLGGWVTTIVQQDTNAKKSRTVKSQTYRGVRSIIENRAHYGTLPIFWAVKGTRFAKQAYCADPDAVVDSYKRVAAGESLAKIARSHGLYAQRFKNLIRASVNHTGIVECSYTHEGNTETWTHKTEPVVESSLWWAANKILDANKKRTGENKGGRPPVDNWVSGTLACPGCGHSLYVNGGFTPKGTPRTVKLRCSGKNSERVACGKFKGINAQPVIDAIDRMFASNKTEVLSFQRIAGNAHEIDNLKADLARIQARLSATDDDDELDALIAERKAIKASIEGFEVTPDSFDYAPTGQTVGQMWTAGDSAVKRDMVRAVKDAGGITLTAAGVVERLELEPWVGDPTDAGIVNLGGGLCFRRFTITEHNADAWEHP